MAGLAVVEVGTEDAQNLDQYIRVVGAFAEPKPPVSVRAGYRT